MKLITSKVLSTLVLMLCLASTASALPILEQGARKNTLHGKNLNGIAATATIEAFYNINESKNGNNNDTINRTDASTWAAGLTDDSFTDWYLPTLGSNSTLAILGGDTFNTNLSNNKLTDLSTATTTTNGSNPVSKKGYLSYTTLGSLSVCNPYEGESSTSCSTQSGFGLNNSSELTDLLSRNYWSSVELDFSNAWYFDFDNEFQNYTDTSNSLFALADRSDDAAAVPTPAAAWLMGSILLGLAGFERKRR